MQLNSNKKKSNSYFTNLSSNSEFFTDTFFQKISGKIDVYFLQWNFLNIRKSDFTSFFPNYDYFFFVKKLIFFFLLQLDRDDDGTYQASGSANIILYVGLGMICIGLVITFVGLGDKGFRTLELKLIGPSLVGCGLFFALLRVLFCTVPSCCRAMCPCCKCCRKDEETEELIYATVSAISVLIIAVERNFFSSQEIQLE